MASILNYAINILSEDNSVQSRVTSMHVTFLKLLVWQNENGTIFPILAVPPRYHSLSFYLFLEGEIGRRCLKLVRNLITVWNISYFHRSPHCLLQFQRNALNPPPLPDNLCMYQLLKPQVCNKHSSLLISNLLLLTTCSYFILHLFPFLLQFRVIFLTSASSVVYLIYEFTKWEGRQENSKNRRGCFVNILT